MTDRLQQPNESGERTARRRTPRARAGRIWGARTIPPLAPETAPDSEPTILGFPAEIADESERAESGPAGIEPADSGAGGAGPDVSPSHSEVVALRRADPVGAGVLVLAGVAANVSLLLPWSPGLGPTGLSLVQRGGAALNSGIAESTRSGVWQPLVVVLCGGLLVLLGFLLLVPARAHRLVGVVALLVSLAAATAVVLLLADDGSVTDGFGPGLWCAVAVPLLGVLGSLKAMLTMPLVTLAPR